MTVSLTNGCGTISKTTSISCSGLGLSTLDKNNVHIFPNPSKGIVQIENSNIVIEEVSVLNVLGQIVYNKKGNQSNTLEINLSSLENGIYTVLIASQSGQQIERIEIIK